MSRLHNPKAGFWIRLCVVVIYPVTWLLFRMRWRHAERMPGPDEGGVIVAINHVSQIDTLLMARCVYHSGRLPRFMVKAGLFSKPLVGSIMRGARQIPVYRGTTDAASSLREAVTALEQGEAVVIYPEGTTTKDPDNWPMLAKTGVARLVLLCPDIPVIPIGQWGAHRRRRWHIPTRRLATASIGQPLDLRQFRGAEPTTQTLREITDTIMSAVRDQVAELRGEPAPAEFYRPSRRYVDKPE